MEHYKPRASNSRLVAYMCSSRIQHLRSTCAENLRIPSFGHLENRRPTTEHLLASVYNEMRSETHQLLDVRVKCESLRHDCPCFGSTSTPTIQRFVEQFTSIGLWTRAVARGLLERDWETEQKQRSPHVPQKPSLESKDVTTQNKNLPRAPIESQQSSELFELFRRSRKTKLEPMVLRSPTSVYELDGHSDPQTSH